MRSTNTALPAITAIVERNTGLCAKILQLVNSSFFGRPRRITRIEMAVGLLGMNVLRSLVLSHEIANSFSGAGAAGIISLEDEQAHALLTAALARRFAPTPAEADTAFIAGVLHDVGKLVLASKLPNALRDLLAEARSDGRPLHDIEFERNGASHAEVGACLLGLWGLPAEVVAAVAHHHRPDASPGAHTIRAAEIHVADVLAHELMAGNAGTSDAVASVIPALNEPWLASIGVLDSLPRWRALAAEVWAERPEA
jgi:HD-like signal output (HDOD) protein